MSKERIQHQSDWLLRAIEAHNAAVGHEIKELPWAAVVFRCGTFVRLDCDKHQPVTSFVDDAELNQFLDSDFPWHRFVEKDFKAVCADNQQDFEWSQCTQFPEECRKAYGCLMRSSYPLPGGEGADRNVYAIGEDIYVTTFGNLGHCCFTLFHDSERKVQRRIDADNAEGRRLDYMFPKPFAYIDKHLKVTILTAT